MTTEKQKLDNPVWYSLTEVHSSFAIEYNQMKFYHPDYCPFGGFIDIDETLAGNDHYSAQTNNFYVVGDKPNFSESLKINKELVCNQMVLANPINIEISETIIELQANQKDDLFDLVNLVQPGYFRKETSKLGCYYGIYKNNQLIAVTGERMKMSSFTEISSVVAHPDHTGKGYAKQLVAHTADKIFSENKVPYLHVAENNIGAIKLYEKLGFVTRRKISFWNLLANEFKG
ncbi:MAG TPA: GNAT family N-acetyltransferase [Bacteroidales bacterium]|nr:GNAT family N-acetyltransferase [Bacteroidales bacterium]